MSRQDFEEMDKDWKDRTRPLREHKVSPELMKGFSASVERRLKGESETSPARSGWAGWRPLVPVMAVLVVASALVLRYPVWQSSVMRSPASMNLATAVTDVADEVAALRALGVWTEEDERSVGSADETLIADLEFASTTAAS